MTKPKITLYVDSVSPFAYMGFYALRNFPIFAQCSITYTPILLGGLMKSCNNVPPLTIKNKDKWINLERQRWARLFDIPMSPTTPEGFPPLTLGVQRALCALALEKPDAVPDTLAALYKAMWVDLLPIQKPEAAVRVMGSVVGGDFAKVLFEKGAGKEAKALLVKNTDEAFASGAFGLPWFVATNSNGETEGFWGFDHLGQLTDFLGLERPKDAGWKAML